jgi:hypothetical protein
MSEEHSISGREMPGTENSPWRIQAECSVPEPHRALVSLEGREEAAVCTALPKEEAAEGTGIRDLSWSDETESPAREAPGRHRH